MFDVFQIFVYYFILFLAKIFAKNNFFFSKVLSKISEATVFWVHRFMIHTVSSTENIKKSIKYFENKNGKLK